MADTPNKEDEELGKAIAKIVRSAIGGLNHTNIGYSSEHDYLADPYIDDIMELIKSRDQRMALEARIDELSQNFLDKDETCMIDSVSKEPITVKQRKDYLYERIKKI